jgi:hypothetical protein
MKLKCPDEQCDWVSFDFDPQRGQDQLERQYKGHLAALHELKLLFGSHRLEEWLPLFVV